MKGIGLTLGVGREDLAPVSHCVQVSQPPCRPEVLSERGRSQLCHPTLDPDHWWAWRGRDNSLTPGLAHLFPCPLPSPIWLSNLYMVCCRKLKCQGAKEKNKTKLGYESLEPSCPAPVGASSGAPPRGCRCPSLTVLPRAGLPAGSAHATSSVSSYRAFHSCNFAVN